MLASASINLVLDVYNGRIIGSVRYEFQPDEGRVLPLRLRFSSEGPRILSVVKNNSDVTSNCLNVKLPRLAPCGYSCSDMVEAETLKRALINLYGGLIVPLSDEERRLPTVVDISFITYAQETPGLFSDIQNKLLYSSNLHGGNRNWIPLPLADTCETVTAGFLVMAVYHPTLFTPIAPGAVINKSEADVDDPMFILFSQLPVTPNGAKAHPMSTWSVTTFSPAAVVPLELLFVACGAFSVSYIPLAPEHVDYRQQCLSRGHYSAAATIPKGMNIAQELQNGYIFSAIPTNLLYLNQGPEQTSAYAAAQAARNAPGALSFIERWIDIPCPHSVIGFVFLPIQPWEIPLTPLQGGSYSGIVVIPLQYLVGCPLDIHSSITLDVALCSGIARQFIGTSAHPSNFPDIWFSDGWVGALTSRYLKQIYAKSECQYFLLKLSEYAQIHDNFSQLPLCPTHYHTDTNKDQLSWLNKAYSLCYTPYSPSGRALLLAKATTAMDMFLRMSPGLQTRVQSYARGLRGKTYHCAYNSAGILAHIFQGVDINDGFIASCIHQAGMPRLRCGYHFNTKRNTTKTGTGDHEAIPGGIMDYDDVTLKHVMQLRAAGKQTASAPLKHDQNAQTSSELAVLNLGYPRKTSASHPVLPPPLTVRMVITYAGKTRSEQLTIHEQPYLTFAEPSTTEEIVSRLSFLPNVNEQLQKLLPAGSHKGPYARFFMANTPLLYPPAQVKSHQPLAALCMRLFWPQATFLSQIESVEQIALRPGEKSWQYLAAAAAFFQWSHRIAALSVQGLALSYAPFVRVHPSVRSSLFNDLIKVMQDTLTVNMENIALARRGPLHPPAVYLVDTRPPGDINQRAASLPPAYRLAMQCALLKGFGHLRERTGETSPRSENQMLTLLQKIEESGEIVGMDLVYRAFCEGVSLFRTDRPFSWTPQGTESTAEFECRTIDASSPEAAYVRYLFTSDVQGTLVRVGGQSLGSQVALTALTALGCLAVSGVAPLATHILIPLITNAASHDAAIIQVIRILTLYAASLGTCEAGVAKASSCLPEAERVADIFADAVPESVTKRITDVVTIILGQQGPELKDILRGMAAPLSVRLSICLILLHFLDKDFQLNRPDISLAAADCISFILSRNVCDTATPLTARALRCTRLFTPINFLRITPCALSDLDAFEVYNDCTWLFSRVWPRMLFRGAGFCAACMMGGSCTCSLAQPMPDPAIEMPHQILFGFGYQGLWRAALLAEDPSGITDQMLRQDIQQYAVHSVLVSMLLMVYSAPFQTHNHLLGLSQTLAEGWADLFTGAKDSDWSPAWLYRGQRLVPPSANTGVPEVQGIIAEYCVGKMSYTKYTDAIARLMRQRTDSASTQQTLRALREEIDMALRRRS